MSLSCITWPSVPVVIESNYWTNNYIGILNSIDLPKNNSNKNMLNVCQTALLQAFFTWFSWRGTNGSQHFPLLLIVHAAEQLAFLQHKFITSLQAAFTLTASEAAKVVHLALHAHYQLWASNDLQAGGALPYKQPVHRKRHICTGFIYGTFIYKLYYMELWDSNDEEMRKVL